MYRILLADDEGIMLGALSEIIRRQYGSEVEVALAKSGRTAIEQAESFHPDIIFMDIQMPGINGIQAIREIRSFNSSCLFYVISAYDKFDYAQDAIALGVEKYLMKPISRKTVIETLDEAMAKVDQLRAKRSEQLEIQEKLETVIPVVENGFVSSLLLANDIQDEEYYKQLLEISEDYAYAEVLQLGSGIRDGRLESPVGSRLKAQESYSQIRSIVGNDTPIIILTSYNWDDVMEEALHAGVDTFVPKPLFAGTVLDEFRDAFKRKNAALMKRTADLKGRRILLAEDVDVNAEIMVMLLSMREMEAEVAQNGRIAVEMFAGHPEGYYDAILMDMRMPEMDGLEATRRIRAMDRADAGQIPIIALTANAFDEDVQRSLQAGLNAHLSKPVEADALFETLEGLIQP